LPRHRTATLAVAAITLLGGGLLSAAPASAYVGADTAITFSDRNSANFVQTTVNLAQGVANGDGTRGLSGACHGLSSGVSTTVYGCNLYVNDVLVTKGPIYSLPGVTVASAAFNIAVPQGARVYVCGGVSARFVDNDERSSRTCTPPAIVASV
jgi:hypothetical protein